MKDHNLFFKQATLLICSSLDIEVALGRLRDFLSKHLPVDEIHLNLYEPSIGGLRYIARATAAGGEKISRRVDLPADIIRAIEAGDRLKNYLIINQPEDDPLGRIITREFRLENVSLFALRLKIEEHKLGVADFLAYGANRFTTEHARLFAPLREPFAIAMANALRHQEVVELKERLLSDNRYLNSELLARSGDEVIGAENGLREVMRHVEQVAPLKTTVLLLGETGVGKEVVANAIHRRSPRRREPFIKVNCGAIPENLIDSELFGHEKGAFTGAVSQKRGRFERADKGTLFLDEIGELPPWAQVRLLRVLQTQEIERVGGSPPIKLDIRVIVATHRDLPQMVSAGTFREDLWFRINAYPIRIPPLRLRKHDIPLLVEYFLIKKSQELGIQHIPEIAPGALMRLSQHDWPGNVRELENTVERALIQHRQGPLLFSRMTDSLEKTEVAITFQENRQPWTLDDITRVHIQKILERTNGRINGAQGAAALLGVHPNTLRHRMKKLGIAYGRKRRGDA